MSGHKHAKRKRHGEEEDGSGANQSDGAQGRRKPLPAAAALPWMRVPISIHPGAGQSIERVPGLDVRLQQALSQGGSTSQKNAKGSSGSSLPAVKQLFPVQAVVWTEMGGGLRTEHDLCIAAPTGSGKTLAYALPVVNALAQQDSGSAATSTRQQRTLRALLVLPTGDLAEQVASVMRPLCHAVGLSLQLAAAKVSVGAEADALMAGSHTLQGPGATTTGGSAQHGRQALAAIAMNSVELLACQWAAAEGDEGQQGRGGGNLGGGTTDVLVATPGRLMTHLASTPGFTLRHLRFLVVDETDRLLRQSYQEWLPHVMALLHGAGHDGQAWRSAWRAQPGTPQAEVMAAPQLPRCVKLVVSATLTRDPAKVQRLRLHCPRYVAVTAASHAAPHQAGAEQQQQAQQQGPHRYQLPRSLKEYKLLCSAARKPITLLALLKNLEGQGQCVVFASSLDTTHKLYLLLRAVLDGDSAAPAGASAATWGVRAKAQTTVVECSGHKAAAAQRAEALCLFKSGAARVLVASDVVTRGMDFEGNVSNVINYDAPVYAKTYVHRAGRTARAGREGRVFTLLRDEDVRHFKAMLRKADNSFVADYKLPAGAADAMAASLVQALEEVAALLAAEQEQERQLRCGGNMFY